MVYNVQHEDTLNLEKTYQILLHDIFNKWNRNMWINWLSTKYIW
jgi:hypothetical protein